MNKWYELRKWLEVTNITSSKNVLQKMDQLDEEAIQIAEMRNEHDFEATEEEIERWNEIQKERRDKCPWLYQYLDKIEELKNK